MASRDISQLSDVLQEAAADLDAQMDDLKKNFGALKETLGNVLSAGGSVLSSQLSTARERVKETAGGWLQAGQDAASETLGRAKEHEADFEEAVQLHPVVAVAAAVGIGLVLGAVFTSRSRR